MEGLSREEIERLMFFEQAREHAERDCENNPQDTQALTRWGGALLELAHFCQGGEAYDKIHQAISKFNAALAIDPEKHDALWCLGNAYTSQGFLTADTDAAGALFVKAAGCFERAVAADPGSEVYKKALEMTSKAPALHAELQKQLAASAAAGGGGMGMGGGGGGGGGGGRGSGGRGSQAEANADWWFDVGGWVVLGAIVAGIAFASARGKAAA